MKCFKSEMMMAFFSVFFILYLVFSPILCDLLFALAADNYPPVIAHVPVENPVYGQKLPIRAHIGDQSSLQKVTLVLTINGVSKRGQMRNMSEQVPVVAETRQEARVYSGPGKRYDYKGTMPAGRRFKVAQLFDNYIQIVSSNGSHGFIARNAVKVLGAGTLYSVTLPESITRRSGLTYQIEAEDVYGNKRVTDPFDIRFSTEKQAQARERSSGRQAVSSTGSRTSRPVYKRGWFWLLLLAAGGGTYYYLTQMQSDKEGTVDVLVEWE
ncbi:MAG: hypothetical protein U5R06_13835 [candidate division KSB1 bacterium]|nr:hypothetical protein [candidate division KSB1 bacterium]